MSSKRYKNKTSIITSMNKDVIKWARETAGLTVEEAAKNLGFSSIEKLLLIEGGEQAPTRSMLLKMVQAYRRPLLTFYLETPPLKAPRGEDYRTLPPEHTIKDDAVLDALVRDIKTRHEIVRNILESEEEQAPHEFVGSMDVAASVEDVRGAITTALNFSLDEYRAKKQPEQAFAYLREKAEKLGIFVMLAGNLGSYHTNIPVSVFRGFAIADEIAPFVLINDQDTNTAWSFTLLHELAHIWLGQTGISSGAGDKAVEKFCNEVASTILLPRHELEDLELSNAIGLDHAIELITVFAKKRLVSLKMVAYISFVVGKISRNKWLEIDGAITGLLRNDKERKKLSRKDEDSGPSFFVVRKHRLGNAIVSLVDRNVNAGSLTPVKAAKILGIKPRSVTSLLALQRASSLGRGAS